MSRAHAPFDLIIVGASFAGLVAARTAAMRGLEVAVIDAKPEAGHRVATTGILVKEAAEEDHGGDEGRVVRERGDQDRQDPQGEAAQEDHRPAPALHAGSLLLVLVSRDTVSYGEERPKYDNSREETRRLNRRAALVVNLR